MDLGLDLSAWAGAGWVGVLAALALNVFLAVATVRITQRILTRVDEITDSLKAIRKELESRKPPKPPSV